jgi:hypothetical protein
MKFLSVVFAVLTFTTIVAGQACPLRCPSCTRCDEKKGTCTVPRDFVTCTRNSVAGVCFAGICNTQLSLPVIRASNKCQTYTCPPQGECQLITAVDGSDCTPNNVLYESACFNGVCKRIWLGVTEEFPMMNIGCVGKPDGSVCDTNHLLTDGETCQGGVCKFPNGNYYGYLPATPQTPPV